MIINSDEICQIVEGCSINGEDTTLLMMDHYPADINVLESMDEILELLNK